MKPHVLVAIDNFQERHLRRIAEALEGWGTWERIAQDAPEPEYREGLSRAGIVIGWPRAPWILGSGVRLLQLPSAGYEPYIGKGLGREPGFAFCNARSALSGYVAEHCVALMMGLVRRLPQHIRDMSLRRWKLASYDEVLGRVACIVGLGDIGTEIARRCAGLGMRIVAVRRDKRRKSELVSEIYGPTELEQAVRPADHIFVSLPGGAETAGLISGRVFDAMKHGVCFYNVSRGTVVDDSELVRRLRNGQIGGAGLDVFREEPLPPQSPYWEFENVIITPHVAGRAVHEADRLCDIFVTNLENLRYGRQLINVVHLD